MKINPSAGFEHYKNMVQSLKSADTSATKFQDALKAASAEPTNTDKVMISENAGARAEIGRIAAAVSSQVESTASPERLAALREAVASGTYSVDAEDVAGAILGVLV